MGPPYRIRIREYDQTRPKFPIRGELEQLLSTNTYLYSDSRLAESSDEFEHQAPQSVVTVLSARVFSQKSFHIARGDWSVAGGEEEPYGWQDLRFEVHDGKCIPKYVCETIRPNINTQVSWLRALAGASNIIECSDAQALQAAGDPAIFWALIALSIERGEQPLQLIEVVNRKDWRRPPALEEGHAWRIVIAEIYCDPGTPIPEGYGFPDV